MIKHYTLIINIIYILRINTLIFTYLYMHMFKKNHKLHMHYLRE
jgi:hypothetical protein